MAEKFSETNSEYKWLLGRISLRCALDFLERKKIVQLSERLSKIITEDDAILESITNSVELLSNLLQYWKTADRYTKILIIKMISVELFVDTEKRLYIKENAVFEALRNLNFYEWQPH